MSPANMYIAMLVLTVVNQYANLRILCNTFNEVTMKEYAKDIIIPCITLSIVSLFLPLIGCFFITPSFTRLLLTCTLTFVSVLTASFFFLNKNEKQLAKLMISNLLNRLHIVRNN